jgi:prepilin-type N-terminal cleavage/methylation domain-containing protein
MQASKRAPGQSPTRDTGERGFALVEILVAISILTIGILGLGSAATVQTGGIAQNISSGQDAVGRGYYVSAAIMLAKDRMEQAKHLQYTVGPPLTDQLGNSATSAPTLLPDEAPVSQLQGFNRQVRVQNYPSGTPPPKTVTVTVTFQRPTIAGAVTENVTLSTVIVARP